MTEQKQAALICENCGEPFHAEERIEVNDYWFDEADSGTSERERGDPIRKVFCDWSCVSEYASKQDSE